MLRQADLNHGPGRGGGFDTYAEDPFGHLTLECGVYVQIGADIKGLGLPTVLVQEGGYCVERQNLCLGLLLSGFAG